MRDYPYPIQDIYDVIGGDPRGEPGDVGGLVAGGRFVQLHRMGEPCFVRTDRVSYIGPMLGVSTSYCVIDGCPLIIDEGVEEIMSMLCDK